MKILSPATFKSLCALLALHAAGVEAATVSTTTPTWSRFTDTDIYCGNIGGKNPLSISQCEALCLATPNCNAYTVVGNPGYCYIKNYTCKGTSGWGYTKGYYSGIFGNCQTLYAAGLIPANYNYNGCQNSDNSTTTLPTGAGKKRSLAFKQIELEKQMAKKCPSDLLACPIRQYNTAWDSPSTQEYECVSDNELNSCGSCSNDCEAIPHATSVSCSAGRCTVHDCRKGYLSTGERCVPKKSRGTKRRGTLHSGHSL